ncbi:mediator-associated protein 1 [Pyrus ussuriensis x Pyrus communis]|uniref:Mediator-associated protein 1 n=1 Tax=Pyrus ussuriensis x Pyrus communis TaxID=2448454 RepID=A0A5N5HQA6_9ROSA|nr:probable transcription factor At3g04930 [Pyrus x bretschneideri]KAB2630045.1 mediator-associated protein 1 [Pyrus ussuriensis x Pyrus communis]
MAPDQDDVVLPEGDLSSSSQDDEEEDDVVDEDEEEDDVEDDDDVLNDDVINSASPSTSSAGATDSIPVAIATATPTVTVALPARAPPTVPLTLTSAPTTVIANDAVLSSDPKRHPALSSQPEEKKQAALDDSRRLFQRLWTDEDEIELLQGFLDYTTQRGSRGSHGQNDTALFYDQIKSKLQLDFNKSQLVEKLRRLKKKYRNVLSKIASGKDISFKSPHDQATFEISRKIWSNIGRIGADENALDDEDPPSNPNFGSYEIKAEEAAGFAGDKKSTPRSRKRSRIQPRSDEKRPPPPLRGGFVEPSPVIKDNNNSTNISNNGGGNNCSNCNVQGLIEETVKSCLSPLFKELLSNAMGGGPSRGFGGLAFNPIPLSFGGPPMNLNFGGGEVADDKWRKQQILELEVYSKRLDLVQNQIKVALDELRSNGG